MIKQLILAVCGCFAVACPSQAQPGTLDSTFGSNGVAAIFPGDSGAERVLTDPEGSIVVAGLAYWPIFTLVRFKGTGVVDSSFGIDGSSSFDLGGGINVVQGMAIQIDDKIIMSGYGLGNNGKWSYLLARFNVDGSVDQSFGDMGGVATSFNDNNYGDNGYEVAIQSDGKIVQVGSAEDDQGKNGFGLVRLNSDGSPDYSFGGDGTVFSTFGNNSIAYFGYSLAIQADGKIVAGGADVIDAWQSAFAVARYNTDGTLDASFGSGGKVSTYFGNGLYGDDDVGFDLAIQPDGKIVMTGKSYFLYADSGSKIPLVRYNTDGTLDESFGKGGKVLAYYQKEDFYHPQAVCLQPDGKILVCGYVNPDTTYLHRMFLARFNADGTKDYGFADSSLLVLSLDSTPNSCSDVTLQPDGKILMVGISGYGFTVLRILSGLNVGVLELGEVEQPLQIYPNPVQSSATLTYTLYQAETITIRLLDIHGRILSTLVENEYQPAGEYHQQISLEHLPPGSCMLVITNSTGGRQAVQLTKQ